MIQEFDPVQLLVQGLDPGEEGAAAAEGAQDEAGLQVHGPQEGRQVVIDNNIVLQPQPSNGNIFKMFGTY